MRLTYADRMTSSSVLPPPAARPSRVEALQMKAWQTPELAGVFSSYQINVPQLFADLDRTRLEPAAEEAVAVDDGRSVGVAVLGVAQAPAVRQKDGIPLDVVLLQSRAPELGCGGSLTIRREQAVIGRRCKHGNMFS